MKKLSLFVSIVNKTNNWTGAMVAPLIAVITLIITYEVVLRYVFNNPTIWVHELTQMLFGGFFMLGAGYAFLHKSYVTVDILIKCLSPRKQAIVNLVTSVLLFLFCGVLLYNGSQFAWESLAIGERSDTAWGPLLFPMMMTVPLGAFLLLLQGVVKFIHDLIMAVTGAETI